MKYSNSRHITKDDDFQKFHSISEWGFCRLTNKQLELPIVSDYKGHLFNKEAILEWLITPGKEDYTADQIQKFSHIRKLADVVELKNIKEKSSSERLGDGGSVLQCEYGEGLLGKAAKFVYIVSCGDVLPSTALQMFSNDKCPKCGTPFHTLDVITINPSTEQEIKSLEERIGELDQRNQHHNGSARKKKKRKKISKEKEEQFFNKRVKTNL